MDCSSQGSEKAITVPSSIELNSSSQCVRCIPFTGRLSNGNNEEKIHVSCSSSAGEKMKLAPRLNTVQSSVGKQNFECQITECRSCSAKKRHPESSKLTMAAPTLCSSLFSSLIQKCFLSASVISVEVTMYNKSKYAAEVICVSRSVGLLRVFGVSEDAFMPDKRGHIEPANTLKRKFSIPGLAPPKTKNNLLLLSASSQEDSIFPQLTEDSNSRFSFAMSGDTQSFSQTLSQQQAELLTVAETAESVGIERGLFDRVILGAGKPENRQDKDVRPATPSAITTIPANNNEVLNSNKSLSIDLCSASTTQIESMISELPLGVKTIVSKCLVSGADCPFSTATLLAQKIMSAYLKEKKDKGDAKGKGEVRLPCLNKVLEIVEKFTEASGPHMIHGITSACVIGIVLVLQLASTCQSKKIIIEKKQMMRCRNALSSAMHKLHVLSSSPMYTEKQLAWIFLFKAEQPCHNEKSQNANANLRSFVQQLKEKYGKCPSKLLVNILMEYPESDDDKENTEIMRSPSPKKQRVDAPNISGSLANESQGKIVIETKESQYKALHNLVHGPKVVVNSRTDNRGLLGKKQAPTSFPISGPRSSNVVSGTSSLLSFDCSSVRNASLFSSPMKSLMKGIVPCTPDNSMGR